MTADRLRTKLKKLFAMLGSDNAAEREAARSKIDELLAKNGKNWNDLTEFLTTANAQDWQDDECGVNPGDGVREDPTRPAPLDLIRHILERHLHLNEHQFVVVPLWVVHTFLYERFAITPRLAIESPVPGCGKTTLLNIIKVLAYNTTKTDHITAAALFRVIDRDHPTLLLDEADNQNLLNDPTLRAVINSGHHHGGNIIRVVDGLPHSFATFAPLAFATLSKLPLPVLDRSVAIHMKRSPARGSLTRFDPKTIVEQSQDCDIVHRETFNWAMRCNLNLDPPMPEGLRNRQSDNWRILFSIADACSPAWGEAARDAAVALSTGHDEDPRVLLLADIRDTFDRRPTVDRLASLAIVAALNEMPHGLWSEWRGSRDDQTPRPLSQGEMARMLAQFHIRSKTIWPRLRGPRDRSAKGYFRWQFEDAWASYCSNDTPAHPSNVSYLGDT